MSQITSDNADNCTIFWNVKEYYKYFYSHFTFSPSWKHNENKQNRVGMQTIHIPLQSRSTPPQPFSLLCSNNFEGKSLWGRAPPMVWLISSAWKKFWYIHFISGDRWLLCFPPCSRLYNTNEKSWTEPSIVECAGWREIQNSIYWMGKVGSTCLMEYAFPFSSLESFVRAFLLFQHVVSQNFCPFKLICLAS